jgi:hypothetical protein
MHPLTENLAQMTTDELTKKQSDLLNKITMAYRWGKPEMVQQLQMILDDYQQEINVRNQKQLEEMQKNSKGFKNIIDIK